MKTGSTSSPTDTELTQALRAGDRLAAASLMEKYRPLVISFASGFGLPASDTDDLIQEGLISLLSAAYTFSPDRNTSFKTYLSVCVSNRLRTLVNRRATGSSRPLYGYIPLDSVEIPGGTDPERVIMSEEACEDLAILFETALSALERRVLTAHLAGSSLSEIAEKLGIPKKSADNALTRARNKLKHALSTN